MPDIIFTNGVYKAESKDVAMYLAFNQMGEGHEIYDVVLKSIPKIHGLKTVKKRMELAFDIVEGLEKQQFDIIKKPKT